MTFCISCLAVTLWKNGKQHQESDTGRLRNMWSRVFSTELIPNLDTLYSTLLYQNLEFISCTLSLAVKHIMLRRLSKQPMYIYFFLHSWNQQQTLVAGSRPSMNFSVKFYDRVKCWKKKQLHTLHHKDAIKMKWYKIPCDKKYLKNSD